MSDLNLTPHRELPFDVHGRLRARVLDGLEQQRGTVRPSRRRPAGAWLAAAAAVVALTGVGLVALQGPPPDEPDSAATAARMDRCWNAIEESGKSQEYPARSAWREVLTTSGQGATILAIRADGKPLFCGLTPTTVTVSSATSPAEIGSHRLRPVLAIPGGPMAGLVDAAGPDIELDINQPANYLGGSSIPGRGQASDGMFVHPGPTGPGAKVRFEGGVLPPMGPAVRVVDHPELAAERRSPASKLVGGCLDDNWFELADIDALDAGATVKHGRVTVAAFHGPRAFGVCVVDPAVRGYEAAPYAMFRDVPLPTEEEPVRLHYYEHSGDIGEGMMLGFASDADVIAAGAVSPGVKSVRIGGPRGASALTNVVDGTFVIIASSAFEQLGRDDREPILLEATAYDANGDVLWTGPVEPLNV